MLWEKSTIAALPVDDAPVNLKELESALEVEGAREIAAGFLEDVGGVPDKLTTAVKGRNKEIARAQAHLLKGCCLIIYAKHTAELSADMEKFAINAEFEECEHLLPTLLDSLNRTVECLETYLDES